MLSSYDLAQTAIQSAQARKGGDMVWLAVGEVSILADYFIIVTGYSTTQVRAIARAIEDDLESQRLPRHVEGRQAGNWVLLDYGDVIVHVMLEKERQFYNLEAFWAHAEALPIPQQAESA